MNFIFNRIIFFFLKGSLNDLGVTLTMGFGLYTQDGPGSDDEDDTHGVFTEYVAKGIRKLHPNVRPHPDKLVETTSLAGVRLPDPNYQHSLQEEIDAGVLSDAQIEAVVYANMVFEKYLPDGRRRGFFLGDGAGVGKGREIAAIIKQLWTEGTRYFLWLSVSYCSTRHKLSYGSTPLHTSF